MIFNEKKIKKIKVLFIYKEHCTEQRQYVFIHRDQKIVPQKMA